MASGWAVRVDLSQERCARYVRNVVGKTITDYISAYIENDHPEIISRAEISLLHCAGLEAASDILQYPLRRRISVLPLLCGHAVEDGRRNQYWQPVCDRPSPRPVFG